MRFGFRHFRNARQNHIPTMPKAMPGYLTVGPTGTTTWVHAEGLEKYQQFKSMLPAFKGMCTVPTVHPQSVVFHQAGEAPNEAASLLFGISGLRGMAAQHFADLRTVSPKHAAWPHFTFYVDKGHGPIQTVAVMPESPCTVIEAWYLRAGDFADVPAGVWRVDPVMRKGMVCTPHSFATCAGAHSPFRRNGPGLSTWRGRKWRRSGAPSAAPSSPPPASTLAPFISGGIHIHKTKLYCVGIDGRVVQGVRLKCSKLFN